MALKQLHQLPAGGPLAGDDLLLFRDVSDTTDGPNGTDKKLTAGDFARWVMSTVGGGLSDTNYWAKLLTLNPGTGSSSFHAIYRLQDSKSNASFATITLTAKQEGSGLSTASSRIDVELLSGNGILAKDSFKLIGDNTDNQPMELWVQKKGTYGTIDLVEIYSRGVGNMSDPVYNNLASWTATDPATGAAVSKTSDWAGSGLITSTSLLNGWTGSITYEKLANGEVRGHITPSGLGTIADGTNVFLMPSTFRVASGIGGANVSYKTTLVSGGSGGYFLFDAAGNVKCYAINPSATSGQTDEFTYMARN